ncbi:uncharacterized protein [Nicotiana sylvestris]|uniref:uncharacterized protein n=1 Tax=Nicotiana sylvestris TaxID=4096 RepID=UPI00388CE10E
MVKCEDFMVTRVLVHNGSSANICPLSTLNKLKVDDERIHKNSICVRGFGGEGKDSVGDIVLELKIGPVEFTMEFQVLDIAVSYNLLLNRHWIHAAKAVPSTLHHMAEDDKRPWVYQVFETAPVEKVPEGKCIPNPKIASAFVMVASKMLKNGFVPEYDNESEYDEDEAFEEISKELNHFEEKPKPNLNKTEAINLGDPDNVRETKISVYLEPQIREEIIKALLEYKDIFAWSYDDMPGLITDLVVYKLPVDPAFPPVKQKLRKLKTDMSVKIKEEVTK